MKAKGGNQRKAIAQTTPVKNPAGEVLHKS
jgi:hypothetical protein